MTRPLAADDPTPLAISAAQLAVQCFGFNYPATLRSTVNPSYSQSDDFHEYEHCPRPRRNPRRSVFLPFRVRSAVKCGHRDRAIMTVAENRWNFGLLWHTISTNFFNNYKTKDIFQYIFSWKWHPSAAGIRDPPVLHRGARACSAGSRMIGTVRRERVLLPLCLPVNLVTETQKQ